MRITQPSGEEGCLLQRQEAVNLIGLFPLPIAKDAVNKGIHAGCFCWQVVNNMEGLLGWQEEKPCAVGRRDAISQGGAPNWQNRQRMPDKAVLRRRNRADR